MRNVFFDSTIPEKEAKSRFGFPEFIMMENAAATLEKTILSLPEFQSDFKILILCGCGNNGGDGFALARRLFKLYENLQVHILLIQNPKTQEAITQFQMAKTMGIPFFTQDSIKLNSYDLFVDCIYGTGFHGNLPENVSSLFSSINSSNKLRIACDVPSGLDKFGNVSKNTFNAHYTVTMGALKLSLFSDSAKNLCGNIIVADLGISRTVFDSCAIQDAFLLENQDMELPVRKNKASHKGTYGHTAVFAGEKSGAAILSATAAMNFGSGLTSLIKTENSNIEQFKISPSLMIAEKLPAKTSCVVIGNGLGTADLKLLNTFLDWFKSAENPACVIDADLFSYKNLPELLSTLNSVPNSRIILTPHPKEFQTLVNVLKIQNRNDFTVTEACQKRIELGKLICQKYENITLILKSANTFIVTNKSVYINASGSQSLSKGGSGDILAGLTGALLAQNYSAEKAAITATLALGIASQKLSQEDYSLTPEKLIQNISELQ